MSKFLSMAVMCSMAFSATALAQGVMIEEEDIETVEVDVEVEEAPVSEPAPIPAIEEVAPPKVAADDMTEEYAGDEPEGGAFIDGLSWQVMASAFYNFNTYRVSGPYNSLGYPYTQYMGFGLNFVGGMVAYTGEKWGVVVDLRFGTGAPLLSPLSPVKQGYVSWLPSERLSIDVGFFDTIYGAEVADEWENANYSRGALYFLRQPFNHLGARMGAELSDTVGFTLMLTNGGVLGGGGSFSDATFSSGVDADQVPSVGWQFSFAPGEVFGLYIGGNHGPSGNNGNKDWENFFDVVASISVDWFTLLFNGDYQVNPHVPNGANTVTAFAYGHSLALIFDATDKISFGLRGEHLSGNSNQRNLVESFGGLTTGTITLRYKPVEYLVLSLEGRGEWATRDIYFARDATVDADDVLIANRDTYYSVILGISGHIGN